MNMEALQKSAALPLWDAEETVGTYALPLPVNARQEPALWRDISLDKLFAVGPFRCVSSPQSHIGPFRWAIDF